MVASLTSKITPIINSIKSASPATMAVKAVGIAAAGIALYNANDYACRTAKRSKKITEVDIGYGLLKNAQYNSKGNKFTSIMKDKLFHIGLGSSIAGNVSACVGYVKGFVGNAFKNVIPIGLSAVALCSKGNWGKASAIGLVAHGLYSMFTK